MDASQITKLLQKQNTRYINRSQTVDSSTLTWKNQIQSSKYIKGVKTCDGDQNWNVPTNPCCANQVAVNGELQNTGTYSFGGSGRTTAIQTGSSKHFLNVLAGASGSASQVYSSESITLQRAGKESCGVPGTSPAPANSYVILPSGGDTYNMTTLNTPSAANAVLRVPTCSYICTNTNGPADTNPTVTNNSNITGNPNDLPVNNQSNPYLPPFDTYYRFKNPSAQCSQPIQDQNQKHFVKECHTRFPNANNGVNAVFSPCNNVTKMDPNTLVFYTDPVTNPLTCEGCILESPPDCSNIVSCPTGIINFNPVSSPTPEPPFTLAIEFSWDPIIDGNIALVPQFTESAIDTSYVITSLTNSSGVINTNDGNYQAILTVTKDCCPTQTASTAPCFLAGALVTLADRTEIPIETVKVGDKVLGAFGEINEVIALHRPLLGNNTMTKINNDHSTSSHHPHISIDKKFYAAKPDVAFTGTYGFTHNVIDINGNIVDRFLSGLNKDRLQTMTIGISLQTTGGAKEIISMENYSMAEDTQLYNLVVSGSHTYCVDGYAVTGWPSEEDFNYDLWISK
jgi:hypothetical protein